MVFQYDVEELSDISIMLLKKLEPEPYYVKEYINNICKKLKEEGWLKKENERPWIKTFEKRKYTLKIAFIHARKGEHITGADLVFELKDKKVIFVQSKRVSSDKRIHFNRFQLQKLIDLEWQIVFDLPHYSLPYYRYKDLLLLPLKDLLLHLPLPFLWLYYSPVRVVFYHLIMENAGQKEERFFHTSEIAFTLGGKNTISQNEFLNQGLKPDEFQEMFWLCKIGGSDIKEDSKREILKFYSLFTNRLIIWLNIEEKALSP